MQNKSLLLILFSGMILLLAGCAGTPLFDTTGVATGLTPDRALSAARESLGKRVLWGGTIIATHNLKEMTQIELLTYPLDSSFRPRLNRPAMARVLIQQSGFLEPQVYAKGRRISVLGTLQKMASGQIGEADYRYPVVVAEQIKLWTAHSGNTRFSFGIGVRL